MKPLYELVLPEDYSISHDADSLELFDPEGERIAFFGEAYSVEAVENAAWLHLEESGRRTEREELHRVVTEGFVCPRCGGEREIFVSQNGFSVSGNYDCDVAHRGEDFSGAWSAYRRAEEIQRGEFR